MKTKLLIALLLSACQQGAGSGDLAAEPVVRTKAALEPSALSAADAGLDGFEQIDADFQRRGPAGSWGPELEKLIDSQAEAIARSHSEVRITSYTACRAARCRMELRVGRDRDRRAVTKVHNLMRNRVHKALRHPGGVAGVKGVSLSTAGRTEPNSERTLLFYYRVKE